MYFIQIDSIESIGAKATKEWSLENALKKMKFEWRDIEFGLVPYRDSVRAWLCERVHCLTWIET